MHIIVLSVVIIKILIIAALTPENPTLSVYCMKLMWKQDLDIWIFCIQYKISSLAWINAPGNNVVPMCENGSTHRRSLTVKSL